MRTRFTAVLSVLALLLAAGCLGGQTSGQGSFTLYVSDQPTQIDAFSSLTVTFDEARIFESNTSTEFKTVALNGSQIDLTTVTGARATALVSTQLDAGTYEKIELHASNAEGVIDGETVDVMIPSEKLMLTKPFTVAPNETMAFVFDIHVVQRGGAGGYILRPVISESGTVGEDVEIEEVPPEQARGQAGTGMNGEPGNESTVDEQGQTGSEMMPTSFTLASTEADQGCAADAFYYNGERVDAITIESGVEHTIMFAPDSECTYPSGAEYRTSPDVFTSDAVNGGETTSVTFSASQDFTITQYWPGSSISKGTVQVTVE